MPDDEYTIDCTGDCVVGDHVSFLCATFTGSWRRAKFVGHERVQGEIVADSYGQVKQQHTFTLRLADGRTMRIKGRNLYANGVKRKPWPDERARQDALRDKHERGKAAREQRDRRLAQPL